MIVRSQGSGCGAWRASLTFAHPLCSLVFVCLFPQLNFYGFHKRSSPSSLTSFYHPSFRKGHPELLSSIIRKSPETSQRTHNNTRLAAQTAERIELAEGGSDCALRAS